MFCYQCPPSSPAPVRSLLVMSSSHQSPAPRKGPEGGMAKPPHLSMTSSPRPRVVICEPTASVRGRRRNGMRD
ncbi:hypothetical protein Mp_7g09950 [Marchantia polymorpha subsp. ruderalis]|uniref:Uncharacterized protein n=2 Tax=Marchantia polymorpha TaxID=3197 RepID=A0AAF6BXX9_MARPO|nr:hypothetical protein MARPO_0003s0014 [Marchantia polymorpha]BBN16863.1 hypothetical protein Mp_7g09950 [Marchantia polymorpha subsp. ruderalis]|eukprot:PTQ49103.1 hypothetical protein MARPO_0003s0014 [Marchantia polymorpha]